MFGVMVEGRPKFQTVLYAVFANYLPIRIV